MIDDDWPLNEVDWNSKSPKSPTPTILDGDPRAEDDVNWVIQMTFMGTFSVLSGAANLTVVTVILLSGRLRRSPHLYVANVLLMALISSLVSVPLRMLMLSSQSNNSNRDSRLDDAICKFSTFTAILSQYGIAYTLMSAAVDRYLTVVHGRLGVRRCSGLVYFPIMMSVWGMAFVTALLDVYGHKHQCRVTSVLSSVTLTFTLVFVACWIASNVLYLMMYSHVRSYRRMRPYFRAPLVYDGWTEVNIAVQQPISRAPTSTSGVFGGRNPFEDDAVNRRHRLFGITALINVVCSMLWLPSLVLSVRRLALMSEVISDVQMETSTIDDDDRNVVRAVVAWLELSHVLVVPIIYVCSCSTFRKELLKIGNAYE